MEVYGTIILFAGWLEIPFQNFKKWFVPIASLYLVCVIFSSVGFAFIMYWLMNLVGEFDAALIPSILILSAALSSTDSPAIIPTLNILKFKCPQLKHIAISESALTDVSGSIFTQFLLLALISAPAINNGIFAILGNSFKRTFMMHLHCKSYPALLLPIPMFTFVLGNILAGAGFLAAFTSGLLTDAFGSVLKVFHFYDSLLNHLIKPFLFNILGALVPLGITYQACADWNRCCAHFYIYLTTYCHFCITCTVVDAKRF